MKVIVCGAGQVGFGIARHLSEEGNDVTVVDSSPALMQQMSNVLDVRPILGHGGHPEVLKQAGAADADILIAVTASDEVNMVICEVAKNLFNTGKTIARVRDAHYLDPQWKSLFALDKIPVDVIISPEKEVADAVVRRWALPGAFDNAAFCDGEAQMIGIGIEENCPVVDTPLNQLTGLFPDLEAIVVGVKRDGRLYVPEFDDTLQINDEAYLITSSGDTERTLKIFGHEERQARRIVMVGAGNIGVQVANQLSGQQAVLTLIEADQERAHNVSELLPNKVVVLTGSGLDPEKLVEAGVREADLILALTNNDQVNVLAIMLALQDNCKRGMCLINNSAFEVLGGRFGMEAAINPRAVTISSVLGYVRQGQIVRVHAVDDGSAEVVERRVGDGSHFIGQKIKALDFPTGVRLGAIMREHELIMPRGATHLKKNDRLVIFIIKDAVDAAEDFFSGSEPSPQKSASKKSNKKADAV